MFARITALTLAMCAPALAAVTQTSLTSDGKVTAAFTDTNLKNPWGISFSPTGAFWVSDNATGLTTLYSGTGSIVPLVVAIPAAGGATTTGSPTGQIFNPTTDFTVAKAGKSGAPAFIFDTEDGTISGWAPNVDGARAIVAVDHSATRAVYKGLALYTQANKPPLLLATNFRGGQIEVYGAHYKLVAAYRDRTLPSSYSPYNVAVLGGAIYVTYARVDAVRHDSVSGKGLGVVEKIELNGHVLEKFQGGALNAPWGLAIAPAKFGVWSNKLLVGNFGDGHITAFDSKLHGAGQLVTAAGPVAIDGLWALSIGNGSGAGSTSDIYFTAGINKEADGLFGSLSVAP